MHAEGNTAQWGVLQGAPSWLLARQVSLHPIPRTTTSILARATPAALVPTHRYTPLSATVMEGMTRVAMSVLSERDCRHRKGP